MQTIIWPQKGAGETDYRGVDWKGELDDGETIVSYTFDLPEGMTQVGKSTNGQKTVVKMSGGTVGTTAAISAWIVTSAPRTLEVRATMKIV